MGVLLHKWQIDHDVTWVEILLRVDWEIGEGGGIFPYCVTGQKSTVLSTFLAAFWLPLLVTLMRQSQVSARSTPCLHFVSGQAILLMNSEHGTKIPRLSGYSTYVFLKSDIYSGNTYMYPASSGPIGKVSLDCIWMTAHLLPWTVPVQGLIMQLKFAVLIF